MKNTIRLISTAPLVTSLDLPDAEDVEVPFDPGRGQMLYEKYCNSCHGVGLDGTDEGPPLLPPFCKPSHQGDKVFYRAALQGTRQHHWEFGGMLPLEDMTPKKTDRILSYLRFCQKRKNLY